MSPFALAASGFELPDKAVDVPGQFGQVLGTAVDLTAALGNLVDPGDIGVDAGDLFRGLADALAHICRALGWAASLSPGRSLIIILPLTLLAPLGTPTTTLRL